jgi:hypothetical protein
MRSCPGVRLCGSGPPEAPVVAAEVAAVGLVLVAGGVVVGSVADLVLGQVDEHLPAVIVDPVDHPVALTTLPAAPTQCLEPPTTPKKKPHAATVDHRFLAELYARGGDPNGYAQWRRQVRAAGYCHHPLRLVGAVEHVTP